MGPRWPSNKNKPGIELTKTLLLFVLFPEEGSPGQAPDLPIRHVHSLVKFVQKLTVVPRSMSSLPVRHRLGRFCRVLFLRSISLRKTERTTGAAGVVGPRGPHH